MAHVPLLIKINLNIVNWHKQKELGGKRFMRKKIMTGLIVMAFVCSSLMLMTSCAKKQIQVKEAAQPTAKVKKDDKAKKSAEDAAARAKEAERQARLLELEKAQKLSEQIRAFESSSIYFDFDKSDMLADGEANLKQKANWLLANSPYSVLISGNCDERGTAEYNLALGERRAYSAKKFLEALGVPGDRISTVSYGEERPADPGHNEDAWAKNRRDDFQLSK